MADDHRLSEATLADRGRGRPVIGSNACPASLVVSLVALTTFRMIPIIFSKEQAGPVLGWTSAIAAYGAFLIPKIVGTQIKSGTPEYALYGFAAYYLSCLAVNWWFYARKNAEIRC